MRIVVDMQGAQTESRFRGIGRYTLSFTKAVARNIGPHELILALNGMFRDTIEPIRKEFDGLLPKEKILVWHAPGPVRALAPENAARGGISEVLYEAFLAGLRPDIVHITSLFEGWSDDASISIGLLNCAFPVSVTHYDLIPLLNPEQYLKPHPTFEKFYKQRVASLRKAALYLTISEFARHEALSAIEGRDDDFINVSTAIDSLFKPKSVSEDERQQIFRKFGLNKPFVLYTGGADTHKNLPRLIQAFSVLPAKMRTAHQLVFAGKMPEGNVATFQDCARQAGLKRGELVFTGYVTDDELIQLYNLCKVYVFPSWHEGFGLPALEAMACGAAVLGANASSLPEVIACPKAMFDPLDVQSICDKLSEALESQLFRDFLSAHGLVQARKFCWDATAQKALLAWERKVNDWRVPPGNGHVDLLGEMASRLDALSEDDVRRSAVCLAKNQLNGRERHLLLDVSELCQRDAGTGVQRVVHGYIKELLKTPPSDFRVELVYATVDQPYRYARKFAARLLGQDPELVEDDPMQWLRGDIFFGLDLQHEVHLSHRAFFKELRAEGVSVKFLLHDLLPIEFGHHFEGSHISELHERLMDLFSENDGVVCVSEATASAFEEWMEKRGKRPHPAFQLETVHNGVDPIEHCVTELNSEEKHCLDLIAARPAFLCVSTIEPRKCHEQVLDAAEQLWAAGHDINLVVVGRQGWKVDALVKRIREHNENGKRLFWLEGISDGFLEAVYSSSTCLVAASLNEGFGLPLIEAARHGLPIIARDIPVFREVAGNHAYYFAGNDGASLANVMIRWLSLFRKNEHPTSGGMPWLTWEESAARLKHTLTDSAHYHPRQLLVDVSELVQRDEQTGIQRVVRGILKEFLEDPPPGYSVQPIYATFDDGYRYARRFIGEFSTAVGFADGLEDSHIEYAAGDIFLGLDLQPDVVPRRADVYADMKRAGVDVRFVVYDLLCDRMPFCFAEELVAGFRSWLDVVTDASGAICISKDVADDLARWIAEKGKHVDGYSINWFHLGAEIENSSRRRGLPEASGKFLEQLSWAPTFLMVGTIEPRKGYAQVLDAFELLWAQGSDDANLVIVGKRGWNMDSFVDRMASHPEQGKRLFWLEGVSDEYLEKVYAASDCLIAASYGEGFGLPLIEAAKHRLPILARNISVFREVAGEHAHFFNAEVPAELATAIRDWLALREEKKHPRSDDLPWLTWKQSASNLWRILNEQPNKPHASSSVAASVVCL